MKPIVINHGKCATGFPLQMTNGEKEYGTTDCVRSATLE